MTSISAWAGRKSGSPLTQIYPRKEKKMIRLAGKRGEGAFESQMDEAVKARSSCRSTVPQAMMKKEAGE